MKIGFDINDDINFSLDIDEVIFKQLAKEIGDELQGNKNINQDINALVELKVRELLTRLIEQKYRACSPEQKENLMNNIFNHQCFNQGIEKINPHVWRYALEDKNIVKCNFHHSLLNNERVELNFELENVSLKLNSLIKLNDQAREMLNSLRSPSASANSLIPMIAVDASAKLLSSLSIAQSAIDQTSNIAELKVKTAQAQYHQAVQKLEAAEASAKIQLSNGKADQFAPNDFLNSLNNDKTSFLNSLKKLDSTAFSASKSSKAVKNNETDERVTIRPGR